MKRLSPRLVDLLLIGLVILDLVLVILTFFFPNFWFESMHGIPYVAPDGTPADKVGLLQRTGAVWAAFTLFQAIALCRWRHAPYWLCIIAGIRWTEVFSDWTYIIVAYPDMTVWGCIALGVAPPANWIFGFLLIRTYRDIVSPSVTR